MTIIGSCLMRLVPVRYREAAEYAEAQAVESRLAMGEAVESRERVNHLAARYEDDKLRNHYADRFAQAIGMDHA